MAETLGTGSNSKSYGNGNNTIYANRGNDTIRGGGGNDKLYGEEDHDKLYGQSGNDYLDGGSGNDYLDGGDNQDTLKGGSDKDTLKGGGGDDTLEGGTENDKLYGQAGDDSLKGDDGNDSLDGGDNRDTLKGGSGKDTLRGGNGDDTLEGGTDNDTLYGQTGDDSLKGDAGDDFLDGGDNQDTLKGGSGHDSLKGGNGDDTLEGGTENDTLYGQSGDDSLDGGTGHDYLDGGTDSDTLRGDGGNDTLRGGNGNDWLYGEDSSDTLHGDIGDDRLFGGDGNDSLDGGYNGGTFYSGDGRDSLYGGDGDDTLRGGYNDDYLDGDKNEDGTFSSGNDQLYGGDGNDTLYGRGGDDYLNGGKGSDTLYAGGGNDTLVGGLGNDQLIGAGGDYIDTVDYSDETQSVNVNLSSGTATGSSIGNDTLSNIEKIIGSTAGDTIKGSSANEIFEGDNGNDSLSGEGGNDTLDGGKGNDTIDGGNGNDSLLGGNNNDVISGGWGNDTIDGGEGYDVFTEQRNGDSTLTSNSSTGKGTDTFTNIEEVRLQGGDSNNSFTDNGFEGLSVVAYDEDVSDYTISYNQSTDIWTVDGTIKNQGIDTVNGFDQIAFYHEENPNVNSVFSTAHGATFVSVTAGVDNGIHEVTGGNYGPTNYIIGMEGSTTPTLKFDTTKLVNFVEDITKEDQSIERQRALAKTGLSLAGAAAPVGGGVIKAGGGYYADSYFDEEQAEAHQRIVKNALADEQYAHDSWIDFVSHNRDLVTITDFQIGVDTIVLPSIGEDETVSYQMTGTTGGVTVSIKIGTNTAEDFLFIENNYKDYGLNDGQFADLMLDLVSTSRTDPNDYDGSTISTFTQTPMLLDPNDSTRVNGVGTFAGDYIEGADYTGYSSETLAGTYTLIGKYGDDLLEGGDRSDYLYGGFNSSNDTTPFDYEHDGNDVLRGNEGDDTLIGGSGDDVLYGGLDADTFIFNSTNGTDTIKDFTGSEGDIIKIDQSKFGISSLSDVSFDAATNELFVKDQTHALAVLENQSGFDLATDVVLIQVNLKQSRGQ